MGEKLKLESQSGKHSPYHPIPLFPVEIVSDFDAGDLDEPPTGIWIKGIEAVYRMLKHLLKKLAVDFDDVNFVVVGHHL